MDSLSVNFIIDLLRSGIRLSTPVLLAALGAMISNRAGILNFALEGKMLLGAFLGIIAAYLFHSTYIGVGFAIISGVALGAFFAFVYIRYQVDLIILATALNLFVSEMTVFLLRTFFGDVGSWSDPSIQQLPDINLPVIQNIPILGDLLSGHNIIVYASWIIVILLYITLFHTRFGRHIRAVGENQEAAEALGIDVVRVKYFALMLSGAMAAMGGAFLSVGHLTMFTRNMSNGRGFVGVSAALFGFNHPFGTFLASLLFGLADSMAVRLQTITTIPPSIIQFFPNVLTILVLVLVALRSKWLERVLRRKSRARILSTTAKPTDILNSSGEKI